MSHSDLQFDFVYLYDFMCAESQLHTLFVTVSMWNDKVHT